MNKTQLETEKAALEAELADKEAKAARLAEIELCLADIDKTREAEEYVKANDISDFYFKTNKSGGLAVEIWNKQNGQKIAFSTDRDDDLTTSKEVTVSFTIPANMSSMQQYILACGAVMKSLLQVRIDKLIAQGESPNT